MNWRLVGAERRGIRLEVVEALAKAGLSFVISWLISRPRYTDNAIVDGRRHAQRSAIELAKIG